MTDKTDDDIDDVLVKLAYKHKLQNKLTYEKGTYCVDYPTFNYAHLFKDIKQLCIESDEAREYWQKQFIEQVGEAITENISNSSESDYIKGFDDGLRGAIQTIKEQIK